MSVSTCLWFNGRIREAAELYTSLIPNSRIIEQTEYPDVEIPEDSHAPGDPLTIDFELDGVPYQLLNGGPAFPQSEAASIVVVVDSQDEIDRLWEGLTANGGQESQCGWLKDPFGVSWQIVPRQLLELQQGPNGPAVITEMFTMQKLDIARLEAAAR